MALQAIIFLLLAITGLLALLNLVPFFSSYRLNKKIDVLLENGKVRNLKDIILKQKEDNDKILKEIQQIIKRIEKLENISLKTLQKVGIVRFNAFKEIGGDQSFAIALLDHQNNGVVISSLFDSEKTRVFAKPIKNGESEYLLSKEEREAISKAFQGEIIFNYNDKKR